MDAAATRRQLKIKSGVAKRLLKENRLYRDEVEEHTRKLDKLVAGGSAEAWDLKNGKAMLEESKKMVEDSNTRLGRAVGDLHDLVNAAKKDEGLSQSEELLKAEEALEEASL
ncbi:hypothetical protein EWM64_g9893 [Hericium alpestre]|uniref:Tubulin-specific chaperone A n=1 Tax=Hericium alpestre TaxID=135208 RepID=A0A4Y9ZKF1_9AGAM|nr:hypothetical protein EWM64_g9893 [Hericium alpestre]